MKGLVAAESFFPKMEDLFRKLGAPVKLTRLSLVESSFNLHATSRVGAAGVWQFMPKTGASFMMIDPRLDIDERLSPLKSTVAAAKLLKQNKRYFGNWPLAVTAYNHGLRGLSAHRKSERSQFLSLFYPAIKAALGWAGRNYYAEFLAVLHAEAYRKLYYGEPPVSELRAFAFRKLTEPKTAMQLAMENGIALQEFKLFNPDIRDLRKRLPRGFLVAIPGLLDDVALLTDVSKRRVGVQ